MNDFNSGENWGKIFSSSSGFTNSTEKWFDSAAGEATTIGSKVNLAKASESVRESACVRACESACDYKPWGERVSEVEGEGEREISIIAFLWHW